MKSLRDFIRVGAGEGNRTLDIQLGKLTLYQLSYTRRLLLCCSTASHISPSDRFRTAICNPSAGNFSASGVARGMNSGESMTLVKYATDYRPDVLLAALEGSETGIVIIEGESHLLYVNEKGRKLLGIEPGHGTPDWVREALAPLLARIWESGGHAVERWVHRDLTFRVRARPIDRARALVALEITISHEGQLSQPLSQLLGLSVPEARLLGFVWRGMSNEEIARTLGVRLGTVKSRLFRLYQKLGVKNRASAVLRAAEVLQTSHQN
jgi:DNA-binding CsgD family transcriptional regulator